MPAVPTVPAPDGKVKVDIEAPPGSKINVSISVPKNLPSRSGDSRKREAYEEYSQGATLSLEKSYSASVPLYTHAIALDPHLAGAYNNLGVSLLAAEDYQGAVRNFEEAVRLAPEDIDYRTNLINAQAALANSQRPVIIHGRVSPNAAQIALNEQNRQQAKEMIRLHPDSQIGYIALASADLYANRLSAVDADIKQLAAHHPEPGQLASFQGYLASYRGNAAEAIKYYKIAIQEKPDFPNVYFQWAAAENSLGHTEEALALLKKAVSLNPALRSSLHNRPELQILSGNPEFQKIEAGGIELPSAKHSQNLR